MSACRFTIPTSTIGLGATYKRHQYEDGKCKRCGRPQFVKPEPEPFTSTTEIGGGYVAAEITREAIK